MCAAASDNTTNVGGLGLGTTVTTMIFLATILGVIVIGVLPGITELFPVSSLGHSVLVPGWLGWDKLVGGEAANESFYLAFLVGVHLATGVALLVHY